MALPIDAILFSVLRATIRPGLFIITFTFLFLNVAIAQFQGQITQVCDGNSATKVFATAVNAPSGSWQLYNLNTNTVIANGVNGEYVESSGFSFGNFLQIRDASNNATLAELINAGNGTSFIPQDDGTGILSCAYELSCPAGSFLDLVENGLASGFSNAIVDGIMGANTLSGAQNGSFNALIFGNFTSLEATGDSEGRMAVQNNFTASGGFTVGGGAPTSTGGLHAPVGWDNLVVGGNMNYPVAGGVRGSILYNNYTGTSLPGFIGFTSPTGMYRNMNPDVNWSAALSYFEAFSGNINPSNISSTLTGGFTNGVVTTGGTIFLDGLDANGLVVFELTSISGSTSFDFINTSNADAILVNVGGVSVSISGGSISIDGIQPGFPYTGSDKEFIEKTLWNFYEANSFSMSAYALFGSVLAPFTTTVTVSGGAINGQTVFKGDVNQSSGFEFHNFCFTQSQEFEPEEVIEAELTEGPCYRTLSSPVDNISYATLLDDFWTQGAGITGAKNPTSGTPNVYTLNTGGTDWVAIPDLTQTIPAGTGFLITVFDQDGTGNIPADPWPKILSASGTENAAPVTVGNLPANTSTLDGFAILGNPFKSPIDLDALTRVGVRDAFYVYDRNLGGTTTTSDGVSVVQGGWRSWTGGGAGDLTDGIIKPYQGFVVQTNTDTGTRSVTFPESAKTTGGVFYGKRRTLQNYIRLEAGNEYLYNSMWVRFSENGSYGHGQGDALEMLPMTEDHMLLGSRKQKSGETLFDIGHFPMPGSDTEIPVGFEATLPGNYTIRVTEMDLSSGHTLYFNDRQTGMSLLIDESFKYEFTNDRPSKTSMAPVPCGILQPQMAKTTSMDDRFFISLSPMEFPTELPETLALSQNFPNPFNPSTVIRFEIPEAGSVRLAVYDMLGRQVDVLVDENRGPGVYEVVWEASRFSSGTYLYRLEANGVATNRTMTLVK